MENNSIFAYADYAEFLRAHKNAYRSSYGKVLSVEQWAKRLGYRSPQSVSMLLTKQRLPSPTMIFKIAKDLDLDAKERRYFELLVMLERQRRSGADIRDLIDEIQSLNPDFGKRTPLDAATFAYIADWQHFPIRQLIDSPDFQEDANWISQKLKRKVSPAQVTTAIETMLTLGLLQRKSGQLVLAVPSIDTKPDIPNDAVKSHLKQMNTRATEAIDEIAVDKREFATLTMRFDSSQMTEAKAAIRQFKEFFDNKFRSEESSDVFQLNIQFFSHTV